MPIPTAKSLRPLVLLLPLLAWISPSYALDYPTRPVRFIVSFAAGGPNDTIARILGQYLSEQLGQQFIIENRVGAGGNIGLEDVCLGARRLHHRLGRAEQRHQPDALRQYPVRLCPRLRADCRRQEARQCRGRRTWISGRTLAESVAIAKAKSARVTLASAASAPRRTSPANCWRS